MHNLIGNFGPPKLNPPLTCCGKRMTIEDDCCAYCYECGRFLRNVVACATREHYFANGGRLKTPYNRIKYFRKRMNYILGEPIFISEESRQLIKDNLDEKTPQGLRRTLRRLGLSKYYKHISFLLAEITGEKIPDISADIEKAEWMFMKIEGKIPYYPDVIYDIFHNIDSKHLLLPWIPRR